MTAREVQNYNFDAAMNDQFRSSVGLERPELTHWSRVTHICVGNLTIVSSDNGLSPGRRQAFIWTNAGILLIEPLGTKFGEIVIESIRFLSWQYIWKCRMETGGILSLAQCVKYFVEIYFYVCLVHCGMHIMAKRR